MKNKLNESKEKTNKISSSLKIDTEDSREYYDDNLDTSLLLDRFDTNRAQSSRNYKGTNAIRIAESGKKIRTESVGPRLLRQKSLGIKSILKAKLSMNSLKYNQYLEYHKINKHHKNSNEKLSQFSIYQSITRATSNIKKTNSILSDNLIDSIINVLSKLIL